jgi:uncharacterized protein YbjT (DUF2867 family)
MPYTIGADCSMNPSDSRAQLVPHRVLIAGATGYVGSRLVQRLIRRGHTVRALVRAANRPLAPGCEVVTGDALDQCSFTAAAQGMDTLVHLVGVAHPSPSKAALFESVDLASALVAARAAMSADVRHIVYVSVARPAPVMHAYVEARHRAEIAFAGATIPCTFLRPWYVIGPGHYWPLAILPLYKLFELIPATRATARRLGLVSIDTVLRCLIHAVETPAREIRSWDVPDLRRLGRYQEFK